MHCVSEKRGGVGGGGGGRGRECDRLADFPNSRQLRDLFSWQLSIRQNCMHQIPGIKGEIN